jgi:hypothetical protein
MRRKMLAVLGAVVVVSLAASSSALARAGDRAVIETYPVATVLCARTHAATLPPKLAPQATAVMTACDTLVSAFAPLQSTVDAAEAAFLTTVSEQKALVAAACPATVTDHAACHAARATAKATIATAATTRLNAANAYRAAIEANRTTFWSTIGSLRSGLSSS